MFDIKITPASVRDDLVADCEDAAEWRLHRAAEGSENGRNLLAVGALEAAADRIAGLPGEDPRLRRLARAWKCLGGDEQLLVFTETRRVIKRHGYDGDGTVGGLLAELIQVAEVILFDQRQSARTAGSMQRRLSDLTRGAAAASTAS